MIRILARNNAKTVNIIYVKYNLKIVKCQVTELEEGGLMLPDVKNESVLLVLDELKQRLEWAYACKSKEIFHTEYTAIGKLTEEYHEYLKAVHDKNHVDFRKSELFDIAIVAIHALASYSDGMKIRA